MGRAGEILDLVQAADAAARAGDFATAEGNWTAVLARDPDHPQAHFALGFHELGRGDRRAASARFARALVAAEADPPFKLAVSRAFGRAGDEAGAVRALESALIDEPYFLPAILELAEIHAAAGRRDAAATRYEAALKIAGPVVAWPAEQRAALERGRALVGQEAMRKEAAYLDACAEVFAQAPDQDWRRMRECASIFAGRSQPYRHEPVLLHVPRLPAETFYPREHFDWLEALEARTDAIRAEFLALSVDMPDAFAPYVAYPPGTPVNQWAELNHSRRWSSLFLWKNGRENETVTARCPATRAAVSAVPLARIAGFCPTVMFSVLAPGSRIPPHTGETNARLVVHLPLIVPPGCRYRVGADWREWVEGEAFAFDDSIEHEAVNDGVEPRAVLILDVWNPLLSEAERSCVAKLLAARSGREES